MDIFVEQEFCGVLEVWGCLSGRRYVLLKCGRKRLRINPVVLLDRLSRRRCKLDLKKTVGATLHLIPLLLLKVLVLGRFV